MASHPFSASVEGFAGDWGAGYTDGGRILWLLSGTPSEAHTRRLFEAALAVIPPADFDVPRGGLLTGFWPDQRMLAPLAGPDEAVEPGWREGARAILANTYNLPRPAAGAPFALLAAFPTVSASSSEGWSPRETVRLLFIVAEAGFVAFRHSGLERVGGLDILFSPTGPIGIFTARAPRGTSPERLDAAFETAVEGMLKADPGAFTPWPPWADRRPDGPVLTFPGDGEIEPLGMALFRVEDPVRAQYAVDLGVAARQGGLVPPPEAPS